MTAPTTENRLRSAMSPSLRHHADSPINWQPWDDRAFELARDADAPIFLSVTTSTDGQSWRMESECFRDDAVVSLLNEHFVPIKVDRRERPNVAATYRAVRRVVTGQDGWPLSAWLTPGGNPFYVSGYVPPEPTDQTPGFADLLELIAEKWSSEAVRDEVETRGREWARYATEELGSVPEMASDGAAPPGLDVVRHIADLAVKTADAEHGGWGPEGKFPEPARIRLLLETAERTGDDRYREVATVALTAIADGALTDQIGGGVHRYCVDREWTTPRFEKRLTGNAAVARAFLAGYQATDDPRYARAARETFGFLDRELSHPEGGFFSANGGRCDDPDVPTRDVEPPQSAGSYYRWTPAEVAAAIGDREVSSLACDRFGIRPSSSGSDDRDRSTVPRIDASMAELADEHGLERERVRERLDRARGRLLVARRRRPAPWVDESVVAGWNGLAVWAFADGALVLGDEALADRAVTALEFVRDRHWNGERLSRLHVDRSGASEQDALCRHHDANHGTIADYAFIGRGALACYEATGDVSHLSFAIDIARTITEVFWDGTGRLFYDDEPGISLVDVQETRDWASPSGIAVAIELLTKLDRFTPADGFGDVAERVSATYASRIASDVLRHHSLALSGSVVASGPTIVPCDAESSLQTWQERIDGPFGTGQVWVRRPSTEEQLAAWLEALGLEEVPPVWRSMLDETDRSASARSREE